MSGRERQRERDGDERKAKEKLFDEKVVFGNDRIQKIRESLRLNACALYTTKCMFV